MTDDTVLRDIDPTVVKQFIDANSLAVVGADSKERTVVAAKELDDTLGLAEWSVAFLTGAAEPIDIVDFAGGVVGVVGRDIYAFGRISNQAVNLNACSGKVGTYIEDLPVLFAVIAIDPDFVVVVSVGSVDGYGVTSFAMVENDISIIIVE